VPPERAFVETGVQFELTEAQLASTTTVNPLAQFAAIVEIQIGINA
jgi:hypothetical protein